MEMEFRCIEKQCLCDFSRGSPRCTLGHGRNRRDQGFTFKGDTCGLVVTHATFLCIPLACLEDLHVVMQTLNMDLFTHATVWHVAC